ncbi:MAG: hypothetical protein AAB421_04365 [Patescibacteria group bacterium]
MFENEEDITRSEKLRELRQTMYSRALSKGIRTRPRRELKPIDYGVPSEWEDHDAGVSGTTLAPKVIAAANRVLWWSLIGSVVFFIGSAGIFFYYFTVGSGGTVAAPGNIDISVRGPAFVVGGEPAELQISVVNRNQAMLELADLIVKYPDGTRSPTDFITDLPQQRIALGSIEPGGRRQGTVSAVFIGKESARGLVHVELEYRVANSGAIFVAPQEYPFTFSSSPLSLSLEANKEAIPGQRILLTTKVTSGSDTVLKDALLEMEYPFGFTVDSRTPEPAHGDVWELGDIRPGDEKIISVRGTITGQAGDDRTFRARAGTRKLKTNKQTDIVLAESVHRIVIERPFIGLDILVNRITNDGQAGVISAGDTVTIGIPWVNNLTTPITNAVIVARLSGLPVAKGSVKTPDGFYRSADNTILFDKSTTRGVLEVLEPGERGTVSFSFQVPPESDIASVREAAVDIAVHAAGKRIAESSVPETLQSSVTKTLKLASNVKLIAQGFYYSNPFGSVGPLPPKVNEETTYAVVLTLLNTSNKIKDAVVTAELPPYVRWIGVYSPAQERITFNSLDGTISWTVGDITQSAGVGTVPPRQVAFAVGFTPSSSQVGQQPEIIRALTFKGVDVFTTAVTQTDHPAVNTNLLDDQGFSALEAAVVE